MEALIRVVLADQQVLTIEGLRSILSREKDMDIKADVQRVENLWENLTNHQPQLLIADFNTTEFLNFEHLKQVFKDFQNTQILLITSEADRDNINRAKELGVKGFLTKRCSREEVILAARTVAKGQLFICPSILDILFNESPQQEDDANLTPREVEVLKLIAGGKPTALIASELFVSPHTVQTHRKNIIRKLQIKSPSQFVIHAMDRGLI